MTLNVIGSGFGRTGTMSTKMALEHLGLGPCHHMVEVMRRPEQAGYWNDYVESGKVDFPGAAVWEQTAQAFPDALILHNERPEGTFPRSHARDEFWAHFGGEPA